MPTDIVLQEDFTPIVCLQDEPYCLIGPADGDCSTLEGFINKLSSGDNAVTVAITGLGSPGGLATIALSNAFGCQIRTVTYDSSNDCALAVVTGECDATFINVSGVAGQIEAGTLKLLAVTSAEESRLSTWNPLSRPDLSRGVRRYGSAVCVLPGNPVRCRSRHH